MFCEVIPASVTKISDHAFLSCNDLVSITFAPSSSLKRIEWWSFAYTGINSITIPASVTYLGDSMFVGCTNLPANGVQFEAGSQWYPTGSDLNCSDVSGGAVTIPSGITRIRAFSFFKCTALTSITMACNDIVRIEGHAFYGSGLRSVTIPSSVTVIGTSAFHDSVSLSSVDFAITSSLKTMLTGALRNLAITDIQIPASVTSLERDLFALDLF